MAQEGTTHLPTEVEFAAKREQLSNLLQQLADSAETNPYNDKVKLVHDIFFTDNDEIFGISFVQDESFGKAERRLEIDPQKTSNSYIVGEDPDLFKGMFLPYHPPIDFCVLKDQNGELLGLDNNPVTKTRQLDQLIEVTQFVSDHLGDNRDVSRENPIGDLPSSLKVIVERIRRSEVMQFEYNRNKFFNVLSQFREKAHEVETDELQYADLRSRVVQNSTGWVRVEKDGEQFELKYDRVDYYSNGSWTDFDEVLRREVGNDGEGESLFLGSDIRRDNPFSIIRTSAQVAECIDILELLDKAIPEPVKT